MRFKIHFEADVVYEVNPDSYPEGLSTEEMLALDSKNANEDPFILLDGAEIKATASIVDDATPLTN